MGTAVLFDPTKGLASDVANARFRLIPDDRATERIVPHVSHSNRNRPDERCDPFAGFSEDIMTGPCGDKEDGQARKSRKCDPAILGPPAPRRQRNETEWNDKPLQHDVKGLLSEQDRPQPGKNAEKTWKGEAVDCTDRRGRYGKLANKGTSFEREFMTRFI